ncbi:MAG TPA: cysteate synthase [Prolixibacteraceae bacterium]|nr:cysteate synthase [Prolixibacteraceae bacterium]
MTGFIKTKYHLQSLCCGERFEDQNWELNCPNNDEPSLIRAIYDNKQLIVDESLPGLYKFASWLPISKILKGSGAPVTYKSIALANKLGLTNLHITFNGYWPEKGAMMETGTFKECEAYSVCARHNENINGVMVVASAGNTARAFAKVCSDNKIPVLICVPKDNLNALWFSHQIDPCVKLIAAESGGDYFDAIHLSNLACHIEGFYPEGGAKNVARRDGMGTTVLSAVTTIGKIPDLYFQAIGSGTGAIAAWEANLRFLEDGRYGNNKMKLMLSQNAPFLPIKEAWDADSRQMLPINDQEARKQVEEIVAKVLSNRKPPYSIVGGLYDAMKDAGGEIFAVTNQEAANAALLFLETEGNDIEPAAAVAVASLIQAVKEGEIDKNETIMLNITGGGIEKFKRENKITYLDPLMIFPLNPDPQFVFEKIKSLF